MPRAKKPKSTGTQTAKVTKEDEARLAMRIHDYLTGKEPVADPATKEQYLEVFELLGLLDQNAKGQEVSEAARSKDQLARMAAAMHPAATKHALEMLANDSEEIIRKQALLRLGELE